MRRQKKMNKLKSVLKNILEALIKVDFVSLLFLKSPIKKMRNKKVEDIRSLKE